MTNFADIERMLGAEGKIRIGRRLDKEQDVCIRGMCEQTRREKLAKLPEWVRGSSRLGGQ